ncbi:hypothetical protein F53441_1852 [Fusarium austroafricanum]|uniref:Uncharacterized protein n=1 Tax=Fusarium austroafricanum TaxID=2364996 RepID=A0A8H4KTJ0_9HYPO|nr:hypothetical protein F53441_1852 [Fusarium austroafricanum]
MDDQLQTNIDKCHQIVQDSSKLFTTSLQEPWKKSDKTPYGLDEALENLRSTEPLATHEEQAKRETEQIFLEAGFQAWLAYFLTNRKQAYHRVGQKSSHQTLEAFHRLSTDDRTKVAATIAGIKCHETVDKLLEKLMKPRKRKRAISEIHGQEPFGNTTNSTMSSLPPVNESLPSTDSTMTASTSHTDTTAPNLQPISGMGTVITAPGTFVSNTASDPPTASIQAQQCTLASFPGLLAFFDPIFCGSLSAKDGKANITLNFPHATTHGSQLRCLMSLIIRASEIPLITWRLFQVHIRNGDDGIRHEVLKNGGRGLGSPTFMFQGSLDADIKKVLGSEMAEAIAKSPVREAELSEGIAATRFSEYDRRLAFAPHHPLAGTAYNIGRAQGTGEIFASVEIVLNGVLLKRQQSRFISNV